MGRGAPSASLEKNGSSPDGKKYEKAAAGELQKFAPGDLKSGDELAGIRDPVSYQRPPFISDAAAWMARTIRLWAPHRHRLSSMASMMSAVDGSGFCLQKRGRLQDHAGRAVAALKRIVLHKGFLHRMQLSAGGQPLDGHHLFSADFPDGRLTGTHGLVVDQHGTGAAQSLAAAVFGAGQTQIGPQHPQQRPVPFRR